MKKTAVKRKNIKKHITGSPQETLRLARCFAKGLKPGDIVFLEGGLGSGKTTFVQGVAKGLGIKQVPTSPSFVLMNIYRGHMPLYHFDLYRVRQTEEIRDIGYEEFLYADGVSVIEWPERLKELAPSGYIKIDFKMLGRNKREIRIIF